MESTSNTEIAKNEDSEKKPQVRLVDVQITTMNESLQLIVSFLNLAQKRGSFTIDESAKIWECVKRFIQKSDSATL